MSDEDWVKAAMTDDSVVVELLIRLHRDAPPRRESSPALPLEWRVRQRRSKPILNAKKNPTPTSSPNTPLSWSGATSISGGGAAADVAEESSRPPRKRLEKTRSKVAAANGTTTSRKPRKKKTLAELKAEEILLLKERKHLKRELAALCASLEKQRATNESLKRLKLDLEFQPALGRVTSVPSPEVIPNRTPQKLAPCDPTRSFSQPDDGINHHDTKQLPSQNGSPKVLINQDKKFLLPDLNIPIEAS